ncbi:Asp23/Gls24 family envelope stress response protein [Mahella australiensis]|uniref:Alkaline shock protein 23 n=1 Tax=Mahella australiensis (strain DSM 15567 / CIP 107919 / 50-1 BON) TaxID=697281 RepID=F4A177_MAHA5|nr:protein of unknown function DUF322 [Mahella australiensis 50-1 BON]
MADVDNEKMQGNDVQTAGNIRIADEVVAAIAGVAAAKVEKVTDMSGGLASDIAGILGRKNPAKGVKVQVGDKETSIDIAIIVDYGARIPDVAWKIQENVKSAVEYMTGLKVTAVNVHVQGVNFPKPEETGSSEEAEE